jgi:outer membrane protein assembly factor BamE (lipoprotein component of BamABCDE complex)
LSRLAQVQDGMKREQVVYLLGVRPSIAFAP